MKNKIIDILSENIEQLDKEEIAAALEIPKKTDMGDFAFPCFKLAKVFRKAPNMIAEELTAQINEKGYDIFDKVVNVGAYINFFLAKEAFAKLLDGKIPKVKDLNEEFVRLLSEKKADYSEYEKIKKEMRDYQIAKQNVESFYAAQQSWDIEEDMKKKRQQER